MSEPIGWNVYYGNGQDVRFDHFEPNEEVLGPAASAFADEVEAFTGTGGAPGDGEARDVTGR